MALYKVKGSKEQSNGHWVTITRGRYKGQHVFIKDNQTFEQAIEERKQHSKGLDDRPVAKKLVEQKQNKIDKDDKNRQLEKDVKDVIKTLNDEGSDFTFGEAKIEDGRIKTTVGVFMPDERGYTEKDLEIPISKEDNYDSIKDKLDEWKSKHDSPDTFYDNDLEYDPTPLKTEKVPEDKGYFTFEKDENGQYKEKWNEPKNKDDMTINELNESMLGDKYKGKGETPNLIYSNGRRIDIDNQGNATIWKDGKIERKTRLPEQVSGDKTKQYFDDSLSKLDNNEEWVIDKEPKYNQKISEYFDKQEQRAIENKDYGYGFKPETLQTLDDEFLQNNYNKTKELRDKYASEYEESLKYDQRKTNNRQDTIFKSAGKTKYEYQLQRIQDEMDRRKGNDNSNWREQVKANNEQLEKDLENYKNTHDMRYESEGYYELFRENERNNAKIKKEEPNEPYEFVEAYAGYKDKRNKLADYNEKRQDEGGELYNYNASWTGKEYTNDEFMEHLEDSNWHRERQMLIDAHLTNKQLSYIKDRTNLSMWSVGEELTGEDNVRKMINEAKNNNNNIINDDNKGFEYSFRIGKKNFFNVRYNRVGNNKNMDFSTSADVLNRNRTDYDFGGQAQNDVLRPNTLAKSFYEKWDKNHLKSLNESDYNDLIKDIEDLKKKYPYTTKDNFYAKVELDREESKYRPKKLKSESDLIQSYIARGYSKETARKMAIKTINTRKRK